jgi:RNA polymerase sigma-70 factor (ECF subfamily)
MASEATARDAAERIARIAYGRILAFLAVRWRDVVAAEDALADAFEAALERWPTSGVPEEPERWLATVALRRLSDGARHARLRERTDVVDTLRTMQEQPMIPDGDRRIPDHRIRLMLVCAHPAIDVATRPALILQVVLGIEARTMAPAFLSSPEAMTKRLVRAKAKVRAAGLPFEEPSAEALPERLSALLEAIYAAYALASEGAIVDRDPRDDLRSEALTLAEIVANALPDDAEALGFHALLSFCEARRPAQTDADGELVPLLEQAPSLWDARLLDQGFRRLAKAATLGSHGPFQLEAAIQAAHCHRAKSGATPWAEIAILYERLVAHWPTVGAEVGLAIARAHADGEPSRGEALLRAMPSAAVRSFQPWWVACAHLAEMRGDAREERRCLTMALALTTAPRLQRFLRRKLLSIDVDA